MQMYRYTLLWLTSFLFFSLSPFLLLLYLFREIPRAREIIEQLETQACDTRIVTRIFPARGRGERARLTSRRNQDDPL